MKNNKPSDELSQQNNQDDNGFYKTVGDLQKSEFIQFLQDNAVVPFRLIGAALQWAELEDREKRRGPRRNNPYWDAVLLYIWFQFVKREREEQGRVVEGEIYCSPSYIRNALHWGKTRYKTAVETLKKYNLISRHVKEWHNEKTGRFQTAQTWWAIWN